MMVPVEVLAEKFKEGILVAIEYEWEDTMSWYKDASIISMEE
jgi:hypothetical protein